MSGSLFPISRRLLLDSTPQIVVPPMVSNGTVEESNSGKTDYFDTNMIIILVALLCALICALGINSIVRCALRCTRTFRPETPQQAEATMVTTGLKKRALKQIPVAVYGSKEEAFEVTECPICLGEFVDGEKVRVLPKCNHRFHVRCIDAWLVSHSSCPNCRHSLIDQPQCPPPPQVTPPGRRPGLNHVVIVMDN